MTENFMASDLLATSAAFLLFALFIFVPGYVFGWILDLFGFRERSLLARFAISVPLSIGLCPSLTYLLWRWSLTAVWTMYGACWIAFLALLVRDRNLWLCRPKISSRVAAVLAILAGWVVLGLLCLIDLQMGDRLYFPVVAHDYTLRTAITSAITRTGIPPHNPYFFPGRPFTLHYHYYWFALCSLVDRLGGSLVTARHAMIAGTLWSGIGLIALVPLYLRFFQPKGPVNLEKRMLVGVALLGVTGLDIVPVALMSVSGRILASVEWWNDSAVTAWVHAVLWVPHNVAGLIACLTGFLIICHAARRHALRNLGLSGVIAGLVFASAAGLSVFVSFVFAVFLALWLGVTVIKKRFHEAATLCFSGVLALAALTPYLLALRGGGAGAPKSFLRFTVRPFRIPDAVVQTLWPDQPWLWPVTDLLLLPLNYYLELGFFFLVGLVMWRRMRGREDLLGQKEFCAFAMAATSILICTFLRSTVIDFNDLGRRGFMVAQFILLIWAAELWDDGLLWSHAGNRTAEGGAAPVGYRWSLIATLLILGAAGSLYELLMERFYPLISDDLPVARYEWLSRDHNAGKRTYALRQVYEGLKSMLPESAVVQHNPNAIPGDIFYGMYADRQAAAETSGCAVVFGGDPVLCSEIKVPIDSLFEKPGAVDANRVDAICRTLSIDALVVKDTDKVWADKNSWVWKKQPILANNYARAFLCGRGN